jgi:hypothetical protein
VRLLKTYDYDGNHVGFINADRVRSISFVQDGSKHFAEAWIAEGVTKTIFVGTSREQRLAFVESLSDWEGKG